VIAFFLCLNFALGLSQLPMLVPQGYSALFVSINIIVWWIQRIDHNDESLGVQWWKSIWFDLHSGCI